MATDRLRSPRARKCPLSKSATATFLLRDLLQSEADDIISPVQAVDERVKLRGPRRAGEPPNTKFCAAGQPLGNLTRAARKG